MGLSYSGCGRSRRLSVEKQANNASKAASHGLVGRCCLANGAATGELFKVLLTDIQMQVHCLCWLSFSRFSLSLSTSRSALGGSWAEAFTTDGIVSESSPLLDSTSTGSAKHVNWSIRLYHVMTALTTSVDGVTRTVSYYGYGRCTILCIENRGNTASSAASHAPHVRTACDPCDAEDKAVVVYAYRCRQCFRFMGFWR